MKSDFHINMSVCTCTLKHNTTRPSVSNEYCHSGVVPLLFDFEEFNQTSKTILYCSQ